MLKAIVSLAGVAAGHLGAYKDFPFTMKEAANYFGQASRLAQSRTWTEAEVANVIEEAIREATNFIRRRLGKDREEEVAEAVERARPEIERWVQAEMKTKKKSKKKR